MLAGMTKGKRTTTRGDLWARSSAPVTCLSVEEIHKGLRGAESVATQGSEAVAAILQRVLGDDSKVVGISKLISRHTIGAGAHHGCDICAAIALALCPSSGPVRDLRQDSPSSDPATVVDYLVAKTMNFNNSDVVT